MLRASHDLFVVNKTEEIPNGFPCLDTVIHSRGMLRGLECCSG